MSRQGGKQKAIRLLIFLRLSLTKAAKVDERQHSEHTMGYSALGNHPYCTRPQLLAKILSLLLLPLLTSKPFTEFTNLCGLPHPLLTGFPLGSTLGFINYQKLHHSGTKTKIKTTKMNEINEATLQNVTKLFEQPSEQLQEVYPLAFGK